MKTKITVLVMAALFIFGSLGLFAQPPFIEGEPVTLTGSVVATNRMLTELTVDDQMYYLMMPRFIVLNDGEEITVEGTLIELDERIKHHKRLDIDGNKVLVNTLIVDGKTYDIKKFREERHKNRKDGQGKHHKKHGKKHGQCGNGRNGGQNGECFRENADWRDSELFQ